MKGSTKDDGEFVKLWRLAGLRSNQAGCNRATLIDGVAELTRPMNSSMDIGGFPSSLMQVGSELLGPFELSGSISSCLGPTAPTG